MFFSFKSLFYCLFKLLFNIALVSRHIWNLFVFITFFDRLFVGLFINRLVFFVRTKVVHCFSFLFVEQIIKYLIQLDNCGIVRICLFFNPFYLFWPFWRHCHLRKLAKLTNFQCIVQGTQPSQFQRRNTSVFPVHIFAMPWIPFKDFIFLHFFEGIFFEIHIFENQKHFHHQGNLMRDLKSLKRIM
jgi:hypothetical protein